MKSSRAIRKGASLMLITILVFAFASAVSQQPAQREYVPNAATAVAIAEAVLIPVYGKEKIESERPYKAALGGGVWTVTGTLYCSDGKSPPKESTECVGGTAVVKLSMRDAHIISMIHYK